MGENRNLIQMVTQEFDNLDKDPESRKSAMKKLKSYVKELDSNSIPFFLSQLCESTKETESTLSEAEYRISLYEDIARVHGNLIVSHIDNIMLTIIKTLTNNSYSCTLYQACAKLVLTVARYGLHPTTPDANKQEIMHTLCRPLSDSLLSRENSLSSGAALCLKEIVELDYWRFCSSQMVNEVCQRVAASLEKFMQCDSHVRLVMGLAKSNALVVEGYARLLVRAGVRILKMGMITEDVEKQLLAIRMVNCLMRSLDCKCVMSELSFVIEEFQKVQRGEREVADAAFEAMKTAKRILWSNGDVSLKDGLFLGQMSSPNSAVETEPREDYEDGFSGFLHSRSIDVGSRSGTASPQRSRSHINADSVNHLTRSKNLGKSLHVPGNCSSSNQSGRFRSPPISISISNHDQNGFNESFTIEGEKFDGNSELVSSTEDVCTNGSTNMLQYQEHVPKTQVKSRIMSSVNIYSGLFVLLVAIVCYLWIHGIDAGHNLVPT